MIFFHSKFLYANSWGGKGGTLMVGPRAALSLATPLHETACIKHVLNCTPALDSDFLNFLKM